MIFYMCALLSRERELNNTTRLLQLMHVTNTAKDIIIIENLVDLRLGINVERIYTRTEYISIR